MSPETARHLGIAMHALVDQLAPALRHASDTIMSVHRTIRSLQNSHDFEVINKRGRNKLVMRSRS